eukprot:11195984-Ditylum_brightwellii.AAC.1
MMLILVLIQTLKGRELHRMFNITKYTGYKMDKAAYKMAFVGQEKPNEESTKDNGTINWDDTISGKVHAYMFGDVAALANEGHTN